MNDISIRAENLSKKYSIHRKKKSQRYVALRDIIAQKLLAPGNWFKQDQEPSDQESDFWAISNLSFDIKSGETVGVIGHNGAGKSTLLKVLSRITEPTAGRVSIRGRIASLLEVGTGFHPELTGKENIYLNGAILGMAKAEVGRKFDEIVAFAEVDRFLETPVKRYSSGMYMRLAFAVAAHLEPEILIVDEVLAVGDAEFQKKCLGKMSDVARQGRTVLFVSHNMAAISSLTARSFVMKKGVLVFDGKTRDAIDYYTKNIASSYASSTDSYSGEGVHTKIVRASLLNSRGEDVSQYIPGEKFYLEIIFQTDGSSGLSIEAFLLDAARAPLALVSLYQFHGQSLPERPGEYKVKIELEPLWLASGSYTFNLTTSVVNSGWDHYVEGALEFEVLYSNPLGKPFDFKQSYGYGQVAHLCSSEPIFISLPDAQRSIGASL